MATAEIEARLSRLEEKMAKMEQAQETPADNSHEWLNRVFGIFANDPEFDEAVKAGQEWRKSEAAFEDEQDIAA